MLMHRAPRSARLAVHIALVLASALLLFVTAAMSEPGQSRESSDNSIPSGLVVVRHVKNAPQKDRALDLRALNNPSLVASRCRSIGATSSRSKENRIGRSWMNCSLLQNHRRNGYNSSSSPAFLLLHGHWKA